MLDTLSTKEVAELLAAAGAFLAGAAKMASVLRQARRKPRPRKLVDKRREQRPTERI